MRSIRFHRSGSYARPFMTLVGLAMCACQRSDPPPPRTPTAAPTMVATPPAAPATAPPAAPEPPASKTSMKSFDDDVTFLNQHGAALKVLENSAGGRVALSG